MRRRQQTIEATRDRIAEAAFELHREIGPTHATISAIAERAGVQRHTVYRHFPDLVELIRACTIHGMEVTNLPNPEPWLAIPDPSHRLRAALMALYPYYRANEQLIGNILRDLPVMPELAAGSAPYQDHLGRVWGTVLEPWAEKSGPAGDRVRALVSTALEFGTWQALTRRGGLTDDTAVETMLRAVQGVASS
ncbi:MAG: TetR/AcrR family transcriptional regulator [Chloroflexota bacterium]